eukprot:jgi/Chrzof1/7745/Cz02g35070.t1
MLQRMQRSTVRTWPRRTSHTRLATSTRKRTRRSATAAKRPCILLTNSDAEDLEGLRELAEQIKSTINCEAIIITPSPSPDGGASSHTSISFGKQLQLQQQVLQISSPQQQQQQEHQHHCDEDKEL